MSTTKMSLDEFKKLDDAERLFYIYEKLARLDGMEEKYAGKWVEIWLVRGIVIVLLAVLITILSMVGLHAPTLKVGLSNLLHYKNNV